MIGVESAAQMLAACESELPCDIAIFAAAVADWRVAQVAAEKIKKSEGRIPALAMVENPDILATVARRAQQRPAIVVGFAAETSDVVNQARAKLAAKGCDLIVANDVSAASGVFGGDRNKVHIVSAAGVEIWPDMPKQDVARKLMDLLAARLPPRAKAAE
jgi:phosphopantothenoylcysteine decarboxylase/phosphopantothenate--cysteine ligase